MDASEDFLNHDTASRYAAVLLDDVQAVFARPPRLAPEHPALAALYCGLHDLAGRPAAGPCICPLPLAAAADGVLAALASLAPAGALDGLSGSALLAERAALAGLSRNGAASPGGACHLLHAADGRVAVNLARPEDWDLVPAWLEAPAADVAAVAARVAARPVATLVERASWLGLAVAADAYDATPCPWFRITAGHGWRGTPVERVRAPRVLDLSALWAGPLCARLLRRCGAEVVKVESPQRPDGARRGNATFYARLNAGKRCVALDLATEAGRVQLAALIRAADIVIEGTRPRALRQFGLDPETLVRRVPGVTWISVTGYGREPGSAQRVAYGDDAAVAAGLSHLQFEATGRHFIVGDAIADPLTGLHAALAAWASWRDGGGRLISLALRDVVHHVVSFGLPGDRATGLPQRARQWAARVAVADRKTRRAVATLDGKVSGLGTDTAAVFADWGIAC